MRHDDLVYIGHMLDSARKARAKIGEKTRENYDQDENLRLALAYLVQIIGEAASRVSLAFREAHPEIPWKNIIGTRHHVVHDYLDVDYDIVWNAVNIHLPPLISALEKIVSPA
jgi:uncharacterized protein with HEPN domain